MDATRMRGEIRAVSFSLISSRHFIERRAESGERRAESGELRREELERTRDKRRIKAPL